MLTDKKRKNRKMTKTMGCTRSPFPSGTGTSDGRIREQALEAPFFFPLSSRYRDSAPLLSTFFVGFRLPLSADIYIAAALLLGRIIIINTINEIVHHDPSPLLANRMLSSLGR